MNNGKRGKEADRQDCPRRHRGADYRRCRGLYGWQFNRFVCERFGKPAEATQQAEEQKEPQEPYTIADEAEDTSSQFAYKITGTLTNNTDKEKSYIQIEYVLYDADGNQVGTALANTNHLKAGGSWKFEALGTVSPDQVASWERSDVSGF